MNTTWIDLWVSMPWTEFVELCTALDSIHPPCWWEYLVYHFGRDEMWKNCNKWPCSENNGSREFKSPGSSHNKGSTSIVPPTPCSSRALCFALPPVIHLLLFIVYMVVVAEWTCFHQFVFTLYIGKFGRNECAVPACPIIKFWNTSIFIAEQGWIVHNNSGSDLLIACSWAS